MKGVDLDSSLYGFRPDIPNPRPPRQNKTKEKGVSFLSMFRTNEAEEEYLPDSKEVLYEHLEKLVDEIHSLGEDLTRHPGPATVQLYKKTLKQFLQVYQEKGIRAEKQVSTRNVLEQKQFQIIKVIDVELDKLVAGILQSQLSQVELLSRVEEIQGLLVNLLH